MTEDDIVALDTRHVWHPFTQQSTVGPFPEAVSAQGAYIATKDGERLLDLVSSWWVTLHGHSHPAIVKAVTEQSKAMEQVIFADFTHAPAAKLASRLAAVLPGQLNRVFYSDNGSTAVEVALKMAVQYFVNTGDDRRKNLVGFLGGYHGDTVGAMSVGRSSGYFHAWEKMMFPVDLVTFPNTWADDANIEEKEGKALEELEGKLGKKVAAVIIEPLLQGAGGMRMCRPEFLRAVAVRVKAYGALLILDEVLTGFGRTGGLFACLEAGVEPDLICLSKGLTGGFMAMGATVASDRIYDAFLGESIKTAFLHGHSFTANPLGCAAALASLDLLTGADCQKAIQAIASIHAERLAALPKTGVLRHHRQCGTIAAVDFGEGAYGGQLSGRIKAFFRERGMLMRPLGPVSYFMPPFCIDPDDLHRAWDAMDEAAREIG
jgi:adenosylmethionine-8-amino-7-oxononanoate aminotransferase